MVWMKWLGFVLGTLVVVAIGITGYGSWRWAEGTRAMLAQLEAARVSPTPARYNAAELDGLPPPVQRYFRAVLKDGQPLIAAVTVHHFGTFNMSEAAEQWKPFTSTQRVITRRPGCDWDARVMMMPGVPVHVHDAYVAGKGTLHAAVLGLITVASVPDTPDLQRGELMRFFIPLARKTPVFRPGM